MSCAGPQKVLEFSSSTPVALVFGPFCVDAPNARLLRAGQPVALTPKAFEALTLLLSTPGQLVTREQFIKSLWPDAIVEDGNLTSTIWMVRKALAEHEAWIETVPKRGYRFVGPTPAQPSPRAVATGRPASRGPFAWRPRSAWLVGCAVLAVLVAARTVDRPPTAASPRPIGSLAVLPFRSLSTDAEQAYFAEGMTDALITDLARLSALRIVSHQSVRRYRSSDLPLTAIAHDLGVDAVVEGAVGRTGRRLRLTAQLIDARSDRHIWAASYDRGLDDVLALQGELAAAVAAAIQVRVSESERTALSARSAVDPEAYDEYLRGRYFFAQRSETSLAKSIASYRRALERAPAFAPAYAGLAMAYSVSGFYGYLAPAIASTELRAAARRAVELEPLLVDGDVALASLTVNHDWDWEAADRAYRRILERSPDHAQARLWYGLTLAIRGRLEEALVERSRALAADPLSLRFNTSVADTLAWLNRYDEAVVRYRRTLELEPGFPSARLGLGLTLLRQGRNDEAVRLLEEADRVAGDMRTKAALGQAYGLVGRRADARAILRDLRERSRRRYLSPVYLAFVSAGLGDHEAAFADLDHAYADRSPMLVTAKFEPLFDPLRRDPRFAGLLRRLNLPVP